jgi:hypothetical protein
MWRTGFTAVVFVIAAIEIGGCGKSQETPVQGVAKGQTWADRENAAAIAARPDLSPTQAIAQSAKPRNAKMLADERDASEKKFVAAGQLLGYYTATVVSRDIICRSVGVDISSFVRAYQAKFASEYRKSITTLKTQLTNPEPLLAASEERGRSLVQQGMVETAQKNNLTLSALCTGYTNYVDFFVADFDLQKHMPDAYAVMLGR